MIGFFDSGFGGLTVLNACLEKMPSHNYLYLGDNQRAPYGDLSNEIIYEYTRQGVDYLLKQGCQVVVLACNTASAVALRKIQQEFLPAYYPSKRVLGVIIPLIENSLGLLSTINSASRKIAVIGTTSTVKSCSYAREITKRDDSVRVVSYACPALVSVIESGLKQKKALRQSLTKYLQPVLNEKPQILVPACTHYALIENEIKQILPASTMLLNGPLAVAEKLKNYFERHPEIEKRLQKRSLRAFLTTGDAARFKQFASCLTGKRIEGVKKINLI